MSDRDDSLVVVDEASERPLTIPPDLPVLPLRDTVLFPNSFMKRGEAMKAVLGATLALSMAPALLHLARWARGSATTTTALHRKQCLPRE